MEIFPVDGKVHSGWQTTTVDLKIPTGWKCSQWADDGWQTRAG